MYSNPVYVDRWFFFSPLLVNIAKKQRHVRYFDDCHSEASQVTSFIQRSAKRREFSPSIPVSSHRES